MSERRWYLGSMNDGLFIIDRPPRPSNNDHPWHDRPDGPELVLNVTELPQEKAQAIVDAHNVAMTPEQVFLLSAKVRERYGQISDTTLDRWIEDPRVRFPKPIHIGRTKFWRITDLEAFDRAKVADSALS